MSEMQRSKCVPMEKWEGKEGGMDREDERVKKKNKKEGCDERGL